MKDYHDSYSNYITFCVGKKRVHSTEVGALTPVFEKSATELKQKQKLLKCKSTIQIATFNVRTLNRTGHLPELKASVIDHNTDIECVQEHRYVHNEDIKYHDTDNGWKFVLASERKNSANTMIGGEGMFIGPQALKSHNSNEKIQLRMMVAMLNDNPSTTIISGYSPTNVNEEMNLVVFYNKLSSLVHCILIIGGDMNAQIGKNVNNKFSLYNLSNRNGEHPTDFTLENRLICLNYKISEKKGKVMDLHLCR